MLGSAICAAVVGWGCLRGRITCLIRSGTVAEMVAKALKGKDFLRSFCRSDAKGGLYV